MRSSRADDKICCGCKESLPRYMYHKDARLTDGLRSACIDCERDKKRVVEGCETTHFKMTPVYKRNRVMYGEVAGGHRNDALAKQVRRIRANSDNWGMVGKYNLSKEELFQVHAFKKFFSLNHDDNADDNYLALAKAIVYSSNDAMADADKGLVDKYISENMI
jgi:hypothetical protein